jgi:hypothetical protein
MMLRVSHVNSFAKTREAILLARAVGIMHYALSIATYPR